MMFITQLVGVSGQDNLAMVDKNDFVEDALDIGDKMGRNQDTGTLSKIRKDSIKDKITCGRINAPRVVRQEYRAWRYGS